MADAFSRQPGEAGYPDEGDIGDYSIRLCALQNPVVFSAVKDWLQMVALHLVLTDCIEAMKTAFSYCCPVVALACKSRSSQHLDQGEYAN